MTLALLAGAVAARAQVFEENVGASIFHGRWSGGEAVLTGNVKAPASRFSCASCHGRDGLGGREGAYSAPAIQWRMLSDPAAGRPGYDANAFAEAVLSGKSPGGRQLSSLMPKYSFGKDELSALVAYLGDLEAESRTGVRDRHITFSIDYDDGQLAVAEAVQKSLNAALSRIGNPSLYGRSIGFSINASEGQQDAFASVMSPIADPRYFADAATARFPILAPLHALGGAEDPRDVRGLFASRAQQINWLSQQAPADARVVTSVETDKISPARKRLDPGAWSVAPTSSAIFPNGLDVMTPPTLPLGIGVTVYSTIDGSGRKMRAWLDAGATLVLADPRAGQDDVQRRPDLDRLADASVRAIVLALEEAGRDVTRASFMDAFDKVAFKLPDWPPIDFTSQRLTGAVAIKALKLRDPAASGNR